MRHTLLLTCFLFTRALNCHAQLEFAPVGAEWYYRYISFWTNTDAYAHAVCTKDTLISGKMCREICLSRVLDTNNPELCSETLYYRQSGDSIFQYNTWTPGTVKWDLVFRNNMQIGEVLQPASTYPFIVTDIDTVYYDGKPVRWFELRDSFSQQTIRYISDVFGPSRGFFDAFLGTLADSHEYYLRCYEAPGFPQVNINGEACTLIVSTPEPLFEINLFPNPASRSMWMRFQGAWPEKEMKVTIWDELGRLALRETLQAKDQSLDVSTVSSGLCFMVVQCGTVVLQQKFIKL